MKTKKAIALIGLDNKKEKRATEDNGSKFRITTLVLALAIILAIVSCKDNEPDSPIKYPSLVGTKWQLVGFFDVETNTLKEVSEYHLLCSYTLLFYEEQLCAISSSNFHVGPYNADFTSFIFEFRPVSTLAGESDEGILYSDILITKVKSFSLVNDTLKLFYNDAKNYLLYNKTEYYCEEFWL